MKHRYWFWLDQKILWKKKDHYLATIVIRGITKHNELIIDIKSECNESFRKMFHYTQQSKRQRRVRMIPSRIPMETMERERKRSQPREIQSEVRISLHQKVTIDLNYETLDVTFLDVEGRKVFLEIDTYNVTDISMI